MRRWWFSKRVEIQPGLLNWFVPIAGGVAESGHTNYSHHSQSRNYEESSYCGHPQRAQDMVPPHTRRPGIGQGLVHVPDQHGSHEKPNWISRRRR
jgi:hypothetical protein